MVYGVHCEGDTCRWQESINSDTPGLHGQHKIISDYKIIAVADKTRTHGSSPPDIGSVSKDVHRRYQRDVAIVVW